MKTDTSINQSNTIIDTNGRQVLYIAADGKLEVLKKYAGSADELHVRNANGWKLLHCAAAGGHLEVVKAIVEITSKTIKGSQINEPADEGLTALHLAAQQGHLRVAEYLESQGAYIYSTDYSGYTPLHLASEKNHPDVVRFLIDKGTSVNVLGRSKKTPLYLAAENGANDSLEVLLEHSANPNLGLDDNWPIYAAIRINNIEAVNLLAKKMINLDGTDDLPKTTPLHEAIKYKFLEAIEILVRAGADLYKEAYCKGSPLVYAAKHPPCENFFKLLNTWGVRIPIDVFKGCLDKYQDEGSYLTQQLKAAAQEIMEVYDDVNLMGAKEVEGVVA
ncbi:ankyrin repeat domain-containing protein [Candidatus Phycorickettsia trachydisci]|nr:ankyrin repeat domain-containing protein [Candidatus Phycorickettsia trachydisci]